MNRSMVCLIVALVSIVAGLTPPAQAVQHAGLGRWVQRDPPQFEYGEGLNLYWYGAASPLVMVDWLGGPPCGGGKVLCGIGLPPLVGPGGGSVAPNVNWPDCIRSATSELDCLACCNGVSTCVSACEFVFSQPGEPQVDPPCFMTDNPFETDRQACDRFKQTCRPQTTNGNPATGGVICRGGQPVSCSWTPGFRPSTPPSAIGIWDECVIANEDTHHDDIDCNDCQGDVCRPNFAPGTIALQQQCISDLAMLDCFRRKLDSCNTLPEVFECRTLVQFFIDQVACKAAQQACGVKPDGCP